MSARTGSSFLTAEIGNLLDLDYYPTEIFNPHTIEGLNLNEEYFSYLKKFFTKENYIIFKSSYEHFIPFKNFILNNKSTIQIVYLDRFDHIAQTISLNLAKNNDIWHDSNMINSKSTRSNYEFDEILYKQLFNQLKIEKYNWTNFFIQNEIEYLKVYYEDIIKYENLISEKILNIRNHRKKFKKKYDFKKINYDDRSLKNFTNKLRESYLKSIIKCVKLNVKSINKIFFLIDPIKQFNFKNNILYIDIVTFLYFLKKEDVNSEIKFFFQKVSEFTKYLSSIVIDTNNYEKFCFLNQEDHIFTDKILRLINFHTIKIFNIKTSHNINYHNFEINRSNVVLFRPGILELLLCINSEIDNKKFLNLLISKFNLIKQKKIDSLFSAKTLPWNELLVNFETNISKLFTNTGFYVSNNISLEDNFNYWKKNYLTTLNKTHLIDHDFTSHLALLLLANKLNFLYKIKISNLFNTPLTIKINLIYKMVENKNVLFISPFVDQIDCENIYHNLSLKWKSIIQPTKFNLFTLKAPVTILKSDNSNFKETCLSMINQIDNKIRNHNINFVFISSGFYSAPIFNFINDNFKINIISLGHFSNLIFGIYTKDFDQFKDYMNFNFWRNDTISNNNNFLNLVDKGRYSR